MDNILLMTDSYKLSHYKQYPVGTTKVYSYFESRRGAKFDKTTFFGLQYFIKRYLLGVVVSKSKIDQAEKLTDAHVGLGVFNRKGWEHILSVHGGRLPIKIYAVPEGTQVETNNVLMVIENTDPECFWLTNYLETLLVQVWYPCTVASLSRVAKEDILANLKKTGTPGQIDFKLHDFGFRGVSSPESAGIGGLAHMINFKGTDTLAAITMGMEYYDSGICGFSIPASEHSTITSWGKDGEADAYKNMLVQYPEGLVACVSDSYDIFHAIDKIWGDELKNDVMTREGTLVVRPDSGDPVFMVLRCLEHMGEAFGYTLNSKNYKVLDEHVRLIQGDGCSLHTIRAILQAMEDAGWSGDNVAFGMGGGLLQQVNRDTQRFAFKCSSVTVNNKVQDVYKNPISDKNKASKKGRLALIKKGNRFKTIREDELGDRENHLKLVFENGILYDNITFEEVLANSAE